MKAGTIDRLSKECKEAFVARQFAEAKGPTMVHCRCGREIPIRFMFRCLYCGEFYCQSCAEEHFGKTRVEYKKEKMRMMIDKGDTFDLNRTAELLRSGEIDVDEAIFALVSAGLSVDQMAIVAECKRKGTGFEEMYKQVDASPIHKLTGDLPVEFLGAMIDLIKAILDADKEEEGEEGISN